MSSYVLSYSLITAKELIKLSLFFINSKFSFQTTLLYLRERHRQYLFNLYCQELWLQEKNLYSRHIAQNPLNIIKNNMEVNEDTIFDSETDAELINFSDIEIETGTTEVDSIFNKTNFYDTIDPYLVFSNSNLGPITEGTKIRVNGHILQNCERFQINLLLDTPTNDIALHINPRLPQNYIVRNCRLKNYWGNEENSSHVPFTFKRGNRFSVQILVTKEQYLISIDDKHYAGFCHRVPITRVKCLEVKGGVDDIECKVTHVDEYPSCKICEHDEKAIKKRDTIVAVKKDSAIQNIVTEIKENPDNTNDVTNVSLQKKYIITKAEHLDIYSTMLKNLSRKSQILEVKQKQYDEDGFRKGLTLPFYGSLSENLINGSCIRLEGRIKILPHSFFINLQRSQIIWPHPTIAFHFNPRFAMAEGKHVICRNSWFDNKWHQEERSELDTDFTPGRPFTLIFSCKEDHFEVYLNDKLIVEYKYRVDLNIIDTVYIQGDVKLWQISLE